MLVTTHIPAYDDERHQVIATPDEVRDRLSATREDGEAECLIFARGKSGDPGTQHVALAGHGEPTRTCGMVLFADAPPLVIVQRWTGTSDYRLPEIDREAEEHRQTGEQCQHGRGSPRPFRL